MNWEKLFITVFIVGVVLYIGALVYNQGRDDYASYLQTQCEMMSDHNQNTFWYECSTDLINRPYLPQKH